MHGTGMAGSGFFGDAAAQCFGGQDFDKAGLVVVSFIAVDIDHFVVFYCQFESFLDAFNAVFTCIFKMGDGSDQVSAHFESFFN